VPEFVALHEDERDNVTRGTDRDAVVLPRLTRPPDRSIA